MYLYTLVEIVNNCIIISIRQGEAFIQQFNEVNTLIHTATNRSVAVCIRRCTAYTHLWVGGFIIYLAKNNQR